MAVCYTTRARFSGTGVDAKGPPDDTAKVDKGASWYPQLLYNSPMVFGPIRPQRLPFVEPCADCKAFPLPDELHPRQRYMMVPPSDDHWFVESLFYPGKWFGIFCPKAASTR
jgi:hypothetical protein